MATFFPGRLPNSWVQTVDQRAPPPGPSENGEHPGHIRKLNQGIYERQRQTEPWHGILGAPCLVLKSVFQFQQDSSGLPHFDLPTTIGSDHCTIYTSQGETAAPRLASALNIFPALYCGNSHQAHCVAPPPVAGSQRLYVWRLSYSAIYVCTR